MDTLKQVLMKRDELTAEEADEAIELARERVRLRARLRV